MMPILMGYGQSGMNLFFNILLKIQGNLSLLWLRFLRLRPTIRLKFQKNIRENSKKAK